MNLRRRSRMSSEVNTHSLNDIMFFLMLFFLIMSTLVNPSVIKLVLPKSDAGKTVSKQTITISIDKDQHYYLNNEAVTPEAIEAALSSKLAGIEEPTVVLRADNTLPVQVIVDLISIGNRLNVKMILATQNKS